MNKIRIIILLIMLSNMCPFFGQSYENTVKLLNRIDKRMNAYYENAVNSELYSDIDKYYEYLYVTTKKYSPDLINNTLKHKDNLLRALYDDRYLNKLSQSNINFILYNLCLNDYVNLIYNIYSLYEKGVISFYVVYFSIIQDGNLSNQLSKNYEVPMVQNLLIHVISKVKSDSKEFYEDSISQFRISKLDFINSIEDVKSGYRWEKIDSVIEERQSPILKLNCN